MESNQNNREILVALDVDSRPIENWILDSSCTFHMTPNRVWFYTYEPIHKGVVLMGNKASCKVVGIGTVCIRMFNGVVRTLGDVKHVPNLTRNLTSQSTLDAKGYKYTDEGGVLKISKGALVVMKGHQKTVMLYAMQGSTVTGDVVVASFSLLDDEITKLMHMCLGHMDEIGMVELSRRGLLDGQKISYSFVSTAFLGNISKLDSLQAFISQRSCLTIYIKTFGDLQKYLLWEVL